MTDDCATYSLITDLAATMERIKPKWKLAVILYADQDAAAVAACLKKLKWSLDSFMVGIFPIPTIRFGR